MGPSWLRLCGGRRRCCLRGGEREGGVEEACGIPGGGEEDKDRGQEVQGGVDEAQRGREEEGGGSVGGWDPYGVPGVGGELGRGGRRQRPGTGRPRGRCPTCRVSEGGGLSSLPPLIVLDQLTAMARTVGIRSRRVIGVISR